MYEFIFFTKEDYVRALDLLNHTDIYCWFPINAGLRVLLFSGDSSDIFVEKLAVNGLHGSYLMRGPYVENAKERRWK